MGILLIIFLGLLVFAAFSIAGALARLVDHHEKFKPETTDVPNRDVTHLDSRR